MSYSPINYLFEILPNDLREELLNKTCLENVYEIRIVAGNKIVLKTYLGSEHLKTVANRGHVLDVIKMATDNSLYAYNDKILDGYIEYKGLRLGVSGEIVRSESKVSEIKDFNAVIIRLPHEVVGCSDGIFEKIFTLGQVKNTIIFSHPGCGKTTYLRDISRKLSLLGKSVVIIDYKNEISATSSKENLLDVGESLVISNSPRLWGLERAIRNLSPDVIVTDEVYSRDEYEILRRAMGSGVKIIVSAHYDNIYDIPGMFELYVKLRSPIGSAPELYDKNKQKITL